MTEIAVQQQSPNGAALALPAAGAMSRIQSAAQDMSAAHRLAQALCNTAFAPPHFHGKPDEGAAAIMYGDTIGMDPLAALQNIFMISGRPGLYARTMVALVLSKGHEVWTEVDTPDRVVVCGRRKGSDNTERSEWTIDRAKKAGYLNNKKYQTDPQAMLYARASGDVARKVAPDALLGMAYNVEELQLDEAEPEAAPVRRSGAARLASVVGVEPETPAIEAGDGPANEPTEADIEAMNAEAAEQAADRDGEPDALFGGDDQ